MSRTDDDPAYPIIGGSPLRPADTVGLQPGLRFGPAAP